MDDFRLKKLLEYFNSLSTGPSHEHYRLRNVANAIEKELGIVEQKCGPGSTPKTSFNHEVKTLTHI